MSQQTLTKPKTIFLDPKKILDRINLEIGQQVVDLGCGGGYFVLEAARRVGDRGRVFGVDILQSALSALSGRARLFGLFNVRTVWSNAEVYRAATSINDHSCDAVLMVQLLSQSRKHTEIFQEATRMLKIEGAILVVDWRPDHGYRFGPPAQVCVATEAVKKSAVQNGWKCTEEFAAGPYHFGLVLRQ